MEELRILELFSGIGGMHYAFKYAQLPGTVVAAMDINTVANAVYAHNHVATTVQNANIQRLTPKTLEKLRINTLLMSPPCQPHTRQGHQRDTADHRSDALQHMCTLLPQCSGLRYVLMENVKGFEASQARQNFANALEMAGFYWREFILSPTQFGVPNTRHRYYCVARRVDDFSFPGGRIWEEMPQEQHKSKCKEPANIQQLLEAEASIAADAYLPEKVLSRRVWLMDIVTGSARNTMCFTKAYTHYAEGTGSIYTQLGAPEMKVIFEQVKRLDEEITTDESAVEQCSERRLELLQKLRLRYFTAREVARLMSFPESFEFPLETTNRQRYRLLGNSINVCVVGELIKLLVAVNT